MGTRPWILLAVGAAFVGVFFATQCWTKVVPLIIATITLHLVIVTRVSHNLRRVLGDSRIMCPLLRFCVHNVLGQRKSLHKCTHDIAGRILRDVGGLRTQEDHERPAMFH